MTISFNAVPSTLRVPFVAVEINNSNAQQGEEALPYRVLLIGQMTSGSGSPNRLYKISSPDDVIAIAGRGSMLHRQAKAFYAENQFTECWIGVLQDNGAGTAATGTITVTGPATAAGTINLYIGGTLVQIGVANGDVQNTIAANIAAAINANLDLPVTAAASTNVVTVTFRHKGTVGNEIDLRVNYQYGEATPAGVSLAIVAMSGGATNPILDTLITNMGDSWYQVFAFPYTDGTSLTAIETELHSRFGPIRMIDGMCFAAHNDTLSNLSTLGNSRNSPHVSIAATNNSPTPPFECSASIAGAVAFSASNDPALPFQTIPLNWVKAPAEADLYKISDRDNLLHNGISTIRAAAGGVVQIEQLITTYKTNAAGAADESYLYVNALLTLLYLRWSFHNDVQVKYARYKLADDGTRFGAGQPVITPKIAKAEAILWARNQEAAGLLEDVDTFKEQVVVERNATNRNRLDFLLPPNLINQFVVGGVSLQFIL